NMGVQIDRIYSETIKNLLIRTNETDWQWKPAKPCSVVSLFTDGCIEKGLPYLGGGAKYTVVSPHLGGAADVGNSLYAIKKMVYDDQIVSFDTLMEALRNNWEGHEDLQQYARHKYSYYGNDNDESDAIVSRLLSDFAGLTEAYNERSPILFPAGVSTFGRQIQWAPNRVATPFGYKKGAILSNNSSPTPGTDSTGATAMIKSYCKADLGRLVCGTALDVKLFPSTVQGKNGIEAIIALLEGFVKLNGFFMQLDIIDKTILRKAQEHPENYRTLSVRVSGWNARFVTLNKEWQEMIISRTEQGV
ncbi:MAG: hypothetical protein GX815_13010, partial [Clostridiales bacterium]|nr:hypothetical protein [Clostridiales bacterium]